MQRKISIVLIALLLLTILAATQVFQPVAEREQILSAISKSFDEIGYSNEHG